RPTEGRVGRSRSSPGWRARKHLTFQAQGVLFLVPGGRKQWPCQGCVDEGFGERISLTDAADAGSRLSGAIAVSVERAGGGNCATGVVATFPHEACGSRRSFASAAVPTPGEGQTERPRGPAIRTTARGPTSAAEPRRPRPGIGRGPSRTAHRPRPQRPTNPPREARRRPPGRACCPTPRTLPGTPVPVRTPAPSGAASPVLASHIRWSPRPARAIGRSRARPGTGWEG